MFLPLSVCLSMHALVMNPIYHFVTLVIICSWINNKYSLHQEKKRHYVGTRLARFLWICNTNHVIAAGFLWINLVGPFLARYLNATLAAARFMWKYCVGHYGYLWTHAFIWVLEGGNLAYHTEDAMQEAKNKEQETTRSSAINIS